ncbi:MAG: hypothetical protein K2N90_06875 [Lachnospiraceae bacterium]|nr:hypothetical protein [Lachnospiraceae bacterium]
MKEKLQVLSVQTVDFIQHLIQNYSVLCLQEWGLHVCDSFADFNGTRFCVEDIFSLWYMSGKAGFIVIVKQL